MSKIKPIKPNEVISMKMRQIPSEMIESVNELIVENWDGKSSKILLEDVIDRYFSKKNIIKSNDEINLIYKSHWLDFEQLFYDEGWNVIYETPARDEDFKEYYLFKMQ